MVYIETRAASPLQGEERETQRRNKFDCVIGLSQRAFFAAEAVSSTVCGAGLFDGCNNGAPSLFIFGPRFFFFFLSCLPPLVLCLFSEQLGFL